jgi:hypothetical protein
MPAVGTPQTVYGTFNEDRRQMMSFVDTGIVFCGDPSLLKYFYRVRFGGSGKIYVRALVDNTEVKRGYVTLSEDPNQASVFHLPRGCAGYGLRLQLAGIAWWRYYEIEWDAVARQA